jgi:hypothetical protein
MESSSNWTRRQFLVTTSSAAAATQMHPLLAEQKDAFTIPPPTVITGGIRPLLRDNTARPLRYRPEGGDFVIRNGGEFFNRPLYGPISSFRVDAGDRPEFSLYLPGHGGNLKVGFAGPAGSKWAAEAAEVVARYRPGRMIYEIRDPLLGSATLGLELLALGEGDAIVLRMEAPNAPPDLTLHFAFAGASGRKGARNGDIGCENQPISQFFQVRPEECLRNVYTLRPGINATPPSASLHSPAGELEFTFPASTLLAVEDFALWQRPPRLAQPGTRSANLPVLTAAVPFPAEPAFLMVRQIQIAEQAPFPAAPATAFAARGAQLTALTTALRIESPDPYLDAAAPALAIVAEALWDPKQQCVMHGCVAWRSTLAGWRGPYVLDATGNHGRAKLHFRRWLAKQNVSPVTTGDPATGPADPNQHLARKEGMLHSNGDLSGNHYDMNLVFFDVLLRHLQWTGDMEFAREIWPALERHLAWERRMFRREFTVADPAGGSPVKLPLYEAYAAIWASDNLQYNGGGTAHASAYNYFAHGTAADLATRIGKVSTPYREESGLIAQAMQQCLWLPRQGAYAESKDILTTQTVYTNPAAWTLYHTIDSFVPSPRQAWQMCAERLSAWKRIPVDGPDVPAGGWYMLACSDWLPYLWSLTLLVLAENVHTALALWHAGMADEAYRLFKGNLLDSMYMGLCPGDFHMSSALDSHRQEAQRDFGDPTGISSRALVEGLFGVRPNLIAGVVTLHPGFPSDWTHAAFHHPDFDFAWHREGMSETYEFTSRFPADRLERLGLTVPACTTSVPIVTNSGTPVQVDFNAGAVGHPLLRINLLNPGPTYRISIQWHGRAPIPAPASQTLRFNQPLALPTGVTLAQIDDPQRSLTEGRATAAGFHTVFANMRQDDCAWSMPISFRVAPSAPAFLPIPHATSGQRAEPLDLTPHLIHQIAGIFTRTAVYTGPRSPFCSLAIPDTLLGGWANLGKPETIDDGGLRRAGGMLKTPLGVSFRTPSGSAPNCLFLSQWAQDSAKVSVPLGGRAHGVYLLMTGTTLPQCSRMEHGRVTVRYGDGGAATLSLRNPETWWPIEQDYLLDDYLFVNDAPLPPRVSLRDGTTRLLEAAAFKGKGRGVPGGAATILHLPLDSARAVASLEVEAVLYGVVLALLGATLARPG